jgi:hypothetical protein
MPQDEMPQSVPCSWCRKMIDIGKVIQGEQRVPSWGGKFVGFVPSELMGRFHNQRVCLKEEGILLYVCPEDSLGKRDGFDFLYFTCSDECVKLLKNAILLDKSLIQIEKQSTENDL